MFLGRMEFFVVFASLVKLARDLRAFAARGAQGPRSGGRRA
jgi:hypothetical protein